MPHPRMFAAAMNDFVAVANDLFSKFHLPAVRDLSECSPSVFVALYEGILGDRLKDVISSPVTREDEIHNVQCVVDSLAADILHCDLSHISGQAVVDGDAVSIQYLLEILEGLVEYVMEQISSEPSSDTDDFKPLPEVSRSRSEIDDSTRRDRGSKLHQPSYLSKTRSLDSISLPSTISGAPDAETRSEDTDSTAELIRLGEESASFRRRVTGSARRAEEQPTGDLNSTYMKSTADLTGGPLSQLTLSRGSRMSDTGMPARQPTSGSFSSVTWPKAPSTLSSPSDSKPAPSRGQTRPPHTKAHMAERLSPYNSLLGSLMGDSLTGDWQTGAASGLGAGSEMPRRSPRLSSPAATAVTAPSLFPQGSTGVATTTTSTTPGASQGIGRSKDSALSRRKSPRHVPPKDESSRSNGRSSQHEHDREIHKGDPLYPYPARPSTANGAEGAGSRLEGGVDDEGPYPARLPQRSDARTPSYMDASPPTRLVPAGLDGVTRHAPRGASPSSRLPSRGAATTSTHPSRGVDPPPSLSRDGHRASPSRSWDGERYPALLPPSFPTTTTTSTIGTTSRTRYSWMGEERASMSPGIASRLRGSGRQSSASTAQERTKEKRTEDSSLMEDSYDRSFMRRKVARRRRVAFEDEGEAAAARDDNDDEVTRPSQRSRLNRDDEEGEDDDAQMPSASLGRRHGDTRTSGRDLEAGSGSEEENESHIYDFRPRKQMSAKGSKKGGRAKSTKQRGVLLPPSLRARRRPLKVQFEDALNRDAQGLMGRTRHRLAHEADAQARLKDGLHHTFAGGLREVKQGVTQQAERRRQAEKKQDSEYRALYSKPKTSQYQPAKKYTAPLSTEGSRRTSRSAKRSPPSSSKRKRAASSSPTSSTSPVHGGERPLRLGDDDLLPTLMQEFPFLHLSPHTAQRMWAQQMHHMEHLTKTALSNKRKKPKTQLKIEEAEKKHEILVNIMKKELAHNQRLRDLKERRHQEKTLQAKAREQRQVNARARRYYDEFRLRAQSRALKRRTREEQIFKHLFEEGMTIQKARIRELRKYAKEKREDYSKQHQIEIESLENYYRDQFSMLAETISKERKDVSARDRAQANAMQRIKKDMRLKMEREIRDFQEQLHRDEDAEYFRQLEADRMKHELQIAKYKAQL